ncbi:hypothetical protein C8R47DRAFT_253947 [Mycena vitilis]|nr:hypothetical protein C8R47DRAFT_253947 [Mycena vitilis]
MGKPAPIRIPTVPRAICPRPLLPAPLRVRPARRSSTPPTPTEVIVLEFLLCGRSGRSATSILNCAVVGPEICPYFHVVTFPGHTVFRTNEGRDVAEVEWVPNGGGAFVELLHNNSPKDVGKQPVSSWLGVSHDASYRMMHAHGQPYVWVPRNLSICLYEWDPAATDDVPELLARIVKEDGVVTLQISLTAVELGLLEMCVVCVVLFSSGCRID